MREFWLRPAIIDPMASNWCMFFNKIASIILPLLAFFLLISIMFFTTQSDHADSLVSNFNALRFTQKTQNTPNTPHNPFPLKCREWNRTIICPKLISPTNISSKPTTTCPEYFRWIHEDLKPWKQTGITRQVVEKARKTAMFRLIILDGKAYVEQYRGSFQTRSLFTMWGIAQLMRRYPGKLPDLEFMFDADDTPVVQAEKYRGVGSDPPPALFRYCSNWDSLDIVFPDWSFWGWAETNIRPWRGMLEDIRKGNEKRKWEDRVPYAYWKGNPQGIPWRDELMKCNATDKNDWNARLYINDFKEESKKGFRQSDLAKQCTHRYKIYIDGWGWSVSEKYILSCNSPTLLVTLRWYDFFTRGMSPNYHYWPIKDSDKCKSVKYAVEWGNNHTQEAKAIGEAGSRFIYEELKMEFVYDYMFHLLNEYAKLLTYKPALTPHAKQLCAESVACQLPPGNIRWFMEESMEVSPSDSAPCAMPQPYEPHELKAFNYQKMKATKEVEAREAEYWDEHNTNK